MNCSDWEERIALYLGGDLAAAEAAEVQRHLAECIGCQVFSSGLKETLELVREAHQEPLAPAHYTAVRSRVLAELAGGRRWGWAWALAGACALAMVLFAIWPRKVEQLAVARPALPKAPEVAAPARPGPRSRATPAVRIAAVRRRRPARSKRPPEASEPIMVKLETGDPDVIIYWITDSRGEDR